MGLRTQFWALLEVWGGWELGCWLFTRKRLYAEDLGLQVPMVLEHDYIPHTCNLTQPTYIPHTHKIVGTQFCVTLSHPSFRTFRLKRMDHTDIKSKDFSSDNKTHTYGKLTSCLRSTGAPHPDGALNKDSLIKNNHYLQNYAGVTEPVVFMSVSVSTSD